MPDAGRHAIPQVHKATCELVVGEIGRLKVRRQVHPCKTGAGEGRNKIDIVSFWDWRMLAEAVLAQIEPAMCGN